MATFVQTKVEEAVAARQGMIVFQQNSSRKRSKKSIEELIPNLITDPIIARCDDSEQYSRRNNIRIVGVPERAEKSTDEITIDFMKQKLGAEFKENDICRSHRVGRKKTWPA